ncbi:hypothetical protein ABBQ32_14159 [Trebouxia sp. C0010 RCD-2024]
MSSFNFQASLGQSRPAASRNPAYGQPNYMDRGLAGHTYQTRMASRAAFAHIDAKQLLRRVKTESGRSPAVNVLQEQLHRWSQAYSKETIAELVWLCALELEVQILRVNISSKSNSSHAFVSTTNTAWQLNSTK